MVKLVDDTTVPGIIASEGKSVYRQEVDQLVAWCSDDGLQLNVSKNKEKITDLAGKEVMLTLNGGPLSRSTSFLKWQPKLKC